MESQWHSLDEIAKANLNALQIEDFYRYRDSLYKEGLKWDGDAELILEGFIWDNSEQNIQE